MPIATRLRSPWADQAIGAASPLPEYPRPMLARDEWISLNGPWEYAIVASLGALADEERPSSYDGQITVPFAIETVASGVVGALDADETLFYRRLVEFPKHWAGRRVALNFEAVDYEAVVWADGVLAGRHIGGYTPFSVDIEVDDQPIEVVVGVRDPGPDGRQQYGKQSDNPRSIWYTATSGIWQSVWAEPLPATAITAVHTTSWPNLDGLDVIVSAETDGDVEVSVELPDGGTISASGPIGQPIKVAIPDARPWSPDDPHLYRLQVRGLGDEVTSWAGLRTVAIGPIPGADHDERPAVLLNGRPILLNTPLDQGYWPESGMTAPSDEALVFDLEQLRGLGFNGLRKHIKVESRRWYHHADRLGMLVVQDVVNGGKPMVTIRQSQVTMALDVQLEDRSPQARAAAGRRSAGNRRQFEADLTGMIRLLSPHPCIVTWVVFNEGWGQYDARRLTELVRGLDPTRTIDSASGWFDQKCGDFRSRHRYVLKLRRPPRRDRRPFFLSEFGGYNMPVPDRMWETDDRYGYRFLSTSAQLDAALASLYRDQLIPLVDHGLRGACYTQVSDVEIENNGLFSFDRHVLKPDADGLRALNAELFARFAALGEPR